MLGSDKEQLQDSYFDSEEDLPDNKDWWLEDIDFTEEDIKKAIMGTHSTSPGPSGICPKLAKMTVDIIVPVLYRLCRKILDDRIIPVINLLNIISPLLKPGKDQSKPGSYRPVSLT